MRLLMQVQHQVLAAIRQLHLELEKLKEAIQVMRDEIANMMVINYDVESEEDEDEDEEMPESPTSVMSSPATFSHRIMGP